MAAIIARISNATDAAAVLQQEVVESNPGAIALIEIPVPEASVPEPEEVEEIETKEASETFAEVAEVADAIGAMEAADAIDAAAMVEEDDVTNAIDVELVSQEQ